MKTVLFIIFSLFLSVFIKAQNKDLQKLLESHDYIQMSHLDIENWDITKLPTPLLRAYIYSAMAHYEKSNKEIEFILENNDSLTQNQDLMAEILFLQATNYYKNYQYKQSAECYKKILDNYSDLLVESAAMVQNKYRLFDALSKIKPLQVYIPYDTQVSTKLDKMGHPLVQVRTPNDSVSLVFDTGSTFSIVTKSVAKMLDIKILADSLIGGGGTGNLEFMSVGVADTLYLGDILYQNVVFLVVEDKKLTFPEHNYSVNGMFGFPEIQILSAIKIYQNGIMKISENDCEHKNNMMFSDANQIIAQINDSLLFWLDTGSAWSSLSVNYYNKNKEQIEETGELSTKVVNSMGGSIEFSIYKLKEFLIKINTTTSILSEIPCFLQPIGTIWYEYDGRLGQDVIKQYDYMLLDFKNMYFSLENTEQ